ncbi:hypothetical protein SBA2_150028 [Acidobacteriia bacterium SbA2]|nr:hypothetical protein SBA2_150028 [Acidobacteriia bacterium SbA2]
MAKVHLAGQGCSGGFTSLCENSILLSFRGAAGDEESRSAIEEIQSETPRGVYPEHPGRDPFTSFRPGSSLRSEVVIFLDFWPFSST